MKNIYLILTFLFIYSCSHHSSSKSLLDKIIERGVLKVGTTGDYAPFSYRKEKDKNFQGIDIDLANELALSLGVKVQFVQTSWKDLTIDLSDNKFDLAMSGISINLKRQKYGLFSDHYFKYGKMPIVRCKDRSKFNSLSKIDSPSTRLIVNPGGTNESYARSSIKRAKIKVFKDNRKIF